MTIMIGAPACLLQCPHCLVNVERGQFLRGGYLTKSSIGCGAKPLKSACGLAQNCLGQRLDEIFVCRCPVSHGVSASLLNSRSHSTVLATRVQNSQSSRERLTVENACCRKGM